MEAGFFCYIFCGSYLSIGFVARFDRHFDGLGIACEAGGDSYETGLDYGDREGAFRFDDRYFDVFLSFLGFIDALFRIFDRRFLYEEEDSSDFSDQSRVVAAVAELGDCSIVLVARICCIFFRCGFRAFPPSCFVVSIAWNGGTG